MGWLSARVLALMWRVGASRTRGPREIVALGALNELQYLRRARIEHHYIVVIL